MRTTVRIRQTIRNGFLVATLLFGLMGVTGSAHAQRGRGLNQQAPARLIAGAQIVADSSPYHLAWTGTSGTFLRTAFGQEPEQKASLVYLHTDPGPSGYSRYLAWFLARDADSYALLWCYLNDSGHDFWCWLYRFPSNQLTTLRFSGDYRFMPLPEPVSASPLDPFRLTTTPTYLGPDFTFRDWTRRSGSLDHLDLRATKTLPASAPGSGATSLNSPGQNDSRSPANSPSINGATATGPPDRTLTNLRVAPLHSIHVGSGNGWREGGWGELHLLAYDAANDPYYLILYTNSTRGYVVDLKHAQVFVTDYGEQVRFSNLPTFGAKDDPFAEMTELRIPRFERHEFTLPAAKTYSDPYREVLLEADFKTPSGTHLVVPGFWDGAGTWRLRITPTVVGTWSWRTRSNDTGLNEQVGSFECVSEGASGKGFLQVQPSYGFRHHFAYMDGSPFLPVLLRDAENLLTTPTTIASSGSGPALVSQTDSESVPETPAAAFAAFQQRVDAYAALGFNRLVGGRLLVKPPAGVKLPASTAQGPLINGDPDRLNVDYFQWLDKRIAYCNEKGIAPDLGIGTPQDAILAAASDAQLQRLWRYVMGRYASYDVCWNLFGSEDSVVDLDAAERIVALAELTHRYDPYHHPLTTVTSGVPPVLPAATTASPAAGPTESSATDGEDAPPAPVPPAPTRKKKVVAAPPYPGTPFARESWLDVITLSGGSLNMVTGDWRFNKPVVMLDLGQQTSVAPASDATRMRMWETRMREGYWAVTAPGGEASALKDSPEIRWATACARFFQQTRYWLLQPHPEMLGGRVETPFERRRRLRAEAAARQAGNPVTPGESTDTGSAKPAPAGTIFILADPAWEYVVYFEAGGSVTLDLLEATGNLKYVWFNPRTGQNASEDTILGGSYRTFVAPDSGDWVLYLSRR